MSLPIDQENRLAALSALHSVCVTAPAGSGKTELLSQRVLTLLARADCPEEILAITFTRKAAAEMHQRIIAALRFAHTSTEPAQAHRRQTWRLARAALERDQHCGWRLLDNSARLQIQTIDSLCSSLTRQMPILSGFGAQPKISDSPELLYRRAVTEFLQALERDYLHNDALMVLLAQLDNDHGKAARLLEALLQRRDQWLMHIGFDGEPSRARRQLEQTLRHIVAQQLSVLAQLLAPLAAELLPLLDYAGDNAAREHIGSLNVLQGIVQLPPANAEALPQWRAIAAVLLSASGEWRKKVDKRQGFPTETADGDKQLAKQRKQALGSLLEDCAGRESLREALAALSTLPEVEFDPQQWQLLQALSQLLPGLVAQLLVCFQQAGEIDFSQVMIAALDALGSAQQPSELLLRLNYRLRHILVDEFQDTSVAQFSLLSRLLEGWREHNAENPQRPNTLFIVGDGMQSIYGFRQAQVGLFLQARREGINGVVLQDLPLQVNFRSTQTIVDWVNHSFVQAFPARDDISAGAVRYEASQAFADATADSEVAVFGFVDEQAEQREAEQVLALIERVRASRPDAQIAILVRSRPHLQQIIQLLGAAGLDWQASDIDPLVDYSVIGDLLSLTKAVLNRADRLAWAALLRSPCCGLDNRDLHRLLTDCPTRSVWQLLQDDTRLALLSRAARERLVAMRAVLLRAFAQYQRKPLRVWLEGLWLALGGVASLADEQQFSMVDDYFDLLESYQQADWSLSLEAFEQALGRLYAKPSSTSSTLHIMTIHKAKGLEFDAVILPGLARQPRSDSKSLLMWREYLGSAHDNGLVMATLTRRDEENTIYRYLRYREAQARELENTRLLYVAATRAISRLYLLFGASTDSKTGDIKAPARQSLLYSIWPALQAQVQWSIAAPAREQMGFDFEPGASARHYRLQSNWSPPAQPLSNPLAAYYLDDAVPDETDELNRPQLDDNALARAVGTVCHQLFDLFVRQGTGCWRDKSAAQRADWLTMLLSEQCLQQSDYALAIAQISTAVENLLQDKHGQWLIAGSSCEDYSERALLACFSSGVQQRIIDRCFIDEHRDCWIIDYKTALPQPGESVADFVEREAQQYRGQLQTYKLFMSLYYAGENASANAEENPADNAGDDTNAGGANAGDAAPADDQVMASRWNRLRTALYFTAIPLLHELSL